MQRLYSPLHIHARSTPASASQTPSRSRTAKESSEPPRNLDGLSRVSKGSRVKQKLHSRKNHCWTGFLDTASCGRATSSPSPSPFRLVICDHEWPPQMSTKSISRSWRTSRRDRVPSCRVHSSKFSAFRSCWAANLSVHGDCGGWTRLEIQSPCSCITTSFGCHEKGSQSYRPLFSHTPRKGSMVPNSRFWPRRCKPASSMSSASFTTTLQLHRQAFHQPLSRRCLCCLATAMDRYAEKSRPHSLEQHGDPQKEPLYATPYLLTLPKPHI